MLPAPRAVAATRQSAVRHEMPELPNDIWLFAIRCRLREMFYYTRALRPSVQQPLSP